MNKKQLHHLWTRIRPIKVWYLLAAFLVFATVAAFSLRNNNLKMVELRNEVYKADEQAGDVEGALQNLRSYVYGHMNTDLSGGDNAVYPPIQLKYTYQRLKEAEKERVKKDNAAIYTEAQAHCEQLNPNDFSGKNRVPCIEKYVSEQGIKEQPIPDALYKFDFYSPRWSPDVAGFSVVFAVIAFVLLVLRVTAGKLLKRLTK